MPNNNLAGVLANLRQQIQVKSRGIRGDVAERSVQLETLFDQFMAEIEKLALTPQRCRELDCDLPAMSRTVSAHLSRDSDSLDGKPNCQELLFSWTRSKKDPNRQMVLTLSVRPETYEQDDGAAFAKKFIGTTPEGLAADLSATLERFLENLDRAVAP